ncbi:MAG: BrnT family toxin [Firmicutes bacterium]|nr:BrnT family toxin [Bacillota bacterium]
MKFEWDEKKNEINIIKHGISFQEAKTVFDDENAVLIYDEIHSEYEERFILIGEDMLFRELTVCHCYRGNRDDIVRLISARKATTSEIKLYISGGFSYES